MDRRNGFNNGSAMALAGWLVSSVIFPFIPEFAEMMKGVPTNLFSYPAGEYLATIGLFAIIFLIIWGPASLWATRKYSRIGFWQVAVRIAFIFLLQMLGCIVIFSFFWNS